VVIVGVFTLQKMGKNLSAHELDRAIRLLDKLSIGINFRHVHACGLCGGIHIPKKKEITGT
jgi:hypothetical protein